ncbi:MAG: 3-deoxy-8-phosphooctulonate synthase, partial [Alphaproteobacteria bacterium]
MTVPNRIQIGNVTVANDAPFVLIAGPCALESRAHAMEMSAALVEITAKLGIGLIYKSSFDKANRTSLDSPRGIGMLESLPILAEVRETYG